VPGMLVLGARVAEPYNQKTLHGINMNELKYII
jgi:hypothetical protein